MIKIADQKDTMIWEEYDTETDEGYGVFFTGNFYLPMYYDKDRNEYVEEENVQFSTLQQAKDHIVKGRHKKIPFWFRPLW